MEVNGNLVDDLTGPLVRGVGEGGGNNAAPSLNNYSVSNPLYIAHRGDAMMYPENTTEGFAASFAAGNRALETDAQLLSDGALGMMHDDTVDRTTTGTGADSSFDTAGWQALQIDAGTWFGGGWGNTLVPPLIVDWINAYKGRVILVPEAKTGAGAALAAALVAANVPRSQAFVQSFLLADLADSVAAGYTCIWHVGTGTAADNAAAATAAGVQWVGVDVAAADSVFTGWVAAGFKVGAYTIKRRWVRDRVLALGVSALFAENTRYLASNAPYATADNFAAQTWQPGMIDLFNLLGSSTRGQFGSPDVWELPLDSGNFASVVQGWAGPVKGNADCDNYSIDFTVKFGATDASGSTRWASVFVGKSDRAFANNAAPSVIEQGYHFLVRKSGNIQIYKRTTSAMTQVKDVATVAIATDASVRYRVTITPTSVNLYRLDGSGNIAYTATQAETDGAFKGGYFHLGRLGLQAGFSDITIS